MPPVIIGIIKEAGLMDTHQYTAELRFIRISIEQTNDETEGNIILFRNNRSAKCL